MDGSTDDSSVEQESVFLHYCNKGKVEHKFVTMGEPESTSSNDLYSFVIEQLHSKNIFSEMNKCVGFGSDRGIKHDRGLYYFYKRSPLQRKGLKKTFKEVLDPLCRLSLTLQADAFTLGEAILMVLSTKNALAQLQGQTYTSICHATDAYGFYLHFHVCRYNKGLQWKPLRRCVHPQHPVSSKAKPQFGIEKRSSFEILKE
ncbi:unnamed protein product [Mytilus coruscus]|uniref:Uncharacterized protein n=1 Tax=Mytilus coruscus TaxID=42192 RepID=A0A6J8EYU0_MYTCO|nr:unnamed protein product [Mytilus coruscus]